MPSSYVATPHVIRRIQQANRFAGRAGVGTASPPSGVDLGWDSDADQLLVDQEITHPTVEQLLRVSERLEVSLVDLLDPLAPVSGEVSWLNTPGPDRCDLTKTLVGFPRARRSDAPQFPAGIRQRMEAWVRLWCWLQSRSLLPASRAAGRPSLTYALSNIAPITIQNPQALEMSHQGSRVGRILRTAASALDCLTTAAEQVLGIPVWVNAPNSSDSCSAPAPACLAAWDSHVVVIINPDSPSSLRDHLVALAVLYALAFQDARMWDRAAMLSHRSLRAFADGLRSGFAGSRLGDRAAPPAGWDAGHSGQEGRSSLPLALLPSTSSVVPTAGLCLWAPALAQSLHAALSAGDLSTRKAASVLGVDLSTMHAWLEGHGIVPDFDL